MRRVSVRLPRGSLFSNALAPSIVATTISVFNMLSKKTTLKTVLLISHNLEHVFEVADRLVILRRGEKVGERLKKSTNKEEVVGLITGAIK